MVSHKQMPVMPLPAYEDMDIVARNSAVKLFNHYQQASSCTAMTNVRAWLQQDPVSTQNIHPFSLADVQHPLSPHMLDASIRRESGGTTESELQAFSVVRKQSFAAALRNSLSYAQLIEHAAKIVMGPDATIRNGPVRTKPDKTGRRIIYPSWESVRPGLDRLGEHAKQYYSWYPGFAALVAQVSLLNLHPLREGNGRLSRIFFNWMMNGERSDPVYLPISELALISSHGLLLRIREAQYFNRWKNLAAFLEKAAEKLFGRE